jgi:hypothetical protein
MGITVNVTGESAVNVTVDGSTSVAVVASGGIGPAGFVTQAGTATSAFGTLQLAAGVGITITTDAGSFLIASYDTAQVAALCPVTSVAGRTGNVVLQASDITAGTFVHGRIPTISYTALSSVPASFTPSAHSHNASDVTSGTLSVDRIPTISYTSLSNVPVTFTPATHTHDASAITAGTLAAARLPTHTHSTTDVVSFTSAASASAPVQSVQGRTGSVSLTRVDLTAAAAAHTHAVSDITNFTNVANVVSVLGITGSVEITSSGLAQVSKSGNTINIGVASSTATAAVIVALWPAIVLGG